MLKKELSWEVKIFSIILLVVLAALVLSFLRSSPTEQKEVQVPSLNYTAREAARIACGDKLFNTTSFWSNQAGYIKEESDGGHTVLYSMAKINVTLYGVTREVWGQATPRGVENVSYFVSEEISSAYFSAADFKNMWWVEVFLEDYPRETITTPARVTCHRVR